MPRPDKSKGQVDRMLVIDDEKNRALDLRPMMLVPPAVGVFDEPTRCYRINHEWAKIVMGMVGWLAEVAPWRDAQHEGYSAIQEILRFKVGEDCMPFILRQNPSNACLIEQSTDGGESWTTAFDLTLCTSIVDNSSSVIINQQYSEYFNNVFQNTYNNFVTNYISSPTDIHSDLAYGAGLDSELDSAYCNTVYTLVSVSSDVAIQGILELDNTQDAYNVGIAIAGAVLTFIAIAGALPTAGASLAALGGLAAIWGASMGVGAALGNKLVDEWQDKTIAQYQDQPAIFEVTCYIVSELPGDSNTQAALLSTLQTHTLTGNAAVIADNLAILLEADATYAAFLEKWHNNLEYAEAGIHLFCPCDGSWLWKYVDTECTYNIPPGWDLEIAAGQCGDGPGTFNGLYEHTGSGDPATLIFTIDPGEFTVLQIRLVAAANTTGFSSSHINVSQGAFVDNRGLAGGFNTYTYLPNETGLITIELQMVAADFQGVGVREIEIDYA